MPRPKGFRLSEEQKKKMKDGRLASKQSHKKPIPIKPEMVITGKEKNGFELWEPLRVAFRSRKWYIGLRGIEKEIVHPAIWENVHTILGILEKYVVVTTRLPTPKKARTPSDKPKRVLTSEHLAAMKAGREKRKAEKGK